MTKKWEVGSWKYIRVKGCNQVNIQPFNLPSKCIIKLEEPDEEKKISILEAGTAVNVSGLMAIVTTLLHLVIGFVSPLCSLSHEREWGCLMEQTDGKKVNIPTLEPIHEVVVEEEEEE